MEEKRLNQFMFYDSALHGDVFIKTVILQLILIGGKFRRNAGKQRVKQKYNALHGEKH